MKAGKNSILSSLKAKVVVFANAKGGVGKSTVSELIARQLVKNGKKVLFIDGDGQSNATESFNFNMEDIPTNNCTKRLFDGSELDLSEIIIYDTIPGLDFIPSHMQLFLTEQALSERIKDGDPRFPRGRVLEKRFEAAADLLKNYDYIIVDVNPYMGPINECFFSIADSIICPVDGPDALTGVLTTIAMWNNAKRYMLREVGEDKDQEAKLLEEDNFHIILNRYQERTGVGQKMMRIMKGEGLNEREDTLYGDFYSVYVGDPIPQSVKFMEQNFYKRSILDDEHKETSNLRQTIKKLVNNLIQEGAL